MRLLIAATVAASLFTTSLLAAEQPAAPLAPGQPAGVKTAQGDDSMDTVYWVLGIAIVIGVAAAVAHSGGSASTTQ